MITVEQYVKKQNADLEAFQEFWTKNANNPSFPKEMDECEFHEQFLIFSDAG